ncbi:hypothetical protein CEXT_36091 [Caerostris extrusa]|uniref:Uncharacterized protein n=1 Tax=Caerostris extrusa TaxID=172846 RepID=A0AAV4MF37_CAEEX|nr:hypothetical protein CEXT_36091 [Caerostris extrusa]
MILSTKEKSKPKKLRRGGKNNPNSLKRLINSDEEIQPIASVKIAKKEVGNTAKNASRLNAFLSTEIKVHSKSSGSDSFLKNTPPIPFAAAATTPHGLNATWRKRSEYHGGSPPHNGSWWGGRRQISRHRGRL